MACQQGDHYIVKNSESVEAGAGVFATDMDGMTGSLLLLDSNHSDETAGVVQTPPTMQVTGGHHDNLENCSSEQEKSWYHFFIVLYPICFDA